MKRWLSIGYRAARRLVVAVVGATVVGLGVAMLVLPGPALVVIPTGLAILALEFRWARRLLVEARERSEEALNGWRGGPPGGSDPPLDRGSR